MRCFMVGLLLLITVPGLVCADPPVIEDVPLIEWYMIDLPPIQNATGDSRGLGYTDLMRWRLIARLDGYRHVLRNSNVQRMLSDIKTKPNICNTAFLKTPEREAFMAYATPLHAQFPNGAVVLKSRLADEFSRYIEEDVLDVQALIEAGGRLVVQSGRSYGRALDQVVAEAEERKQLIVITTNRPVEGKIGLLAAQRAEVALLYPYEYFFFLADTVLTDDYEFFQAAGETGYTLNHLACSRSELGEEVVATVDPLILRDRDGFFAAAYRKWLPPSMLPRHADHHLDAFGVPLEAHSSVMPTAEQAIADCMLNGGVWFQGDCR